MRKLLLLSFVLMFICPILPAQQTLDNDAVIKLAQAGLSDDLLIATIKASPGNYDISMYALDVLRKQRISEKVLAAIVEKASGFRAKTPPGSETAESKVSPASIGSRGAGEAVSATAPGSATAERTGTSTSIGSGEAASAVPATPVTGPNGLPVGINDVGVYYKDKNGAWVVMLPEIVNFQSTGKLKNIASAGIVKGDLEGRIEGTRARVDAKLPVVFAVYLPETVEITEYVLLELHPTPTGRTFLSAAGGLLHTQPGAHRDEIEFQPEKLAPRLYQITLPAIEGRGEYGLLAPGTRFAANRDATAKIYTVSVAE